MTREYVGKGSTIENALENALDQLKAEKKDVDFEVLQEPRKSVFGWRRKPAIIRVTLKKETAKEVMEKEAKFGLVSVVQGRLKYTAPPEGGTPPRLTFPDEIQVQYQGQIVKKGVTLSAGLESLEVTLPENLPPTLHYEIKTDQQKIKAELFWKRTPGARYSLADQGPSPQLHLSLEKKPIAARSLTVQEIEEIVVAEGLVHGVDLTKITPELLNLPSGLTTIAKGTKPLAPRQPSITYVFQEEKPKIDSEAMRIDYYEVYGIQSIKPGAILALKNPGKAGKAGIDVYGQTIEVPSLKELEISIGEGVALSEDGLQAVATVSGLPVLQNGTVKVIDVFELEGNADVSTGNITMDGAIVIKGNVLENVKIESKNGKIVVIGLSSGATLRASDSITVVKNVLRSQLYAGGEIRFGAILNSIGNQLEQLLQAYDAISDQAGDVPFENLIKHLIELKFPELPKEIKTFSDYFQQIEGDCSRELAALEKGLASHLVGTGPLRLKEVNVLRELYSLLRSQELILAGEPGEEANVSVGYLQNSKIEASGLVEVEGQGCYYSTIIAGQGFKMPRGVFRGGEVTVNSGDLSAKEFGGPTGVETNIRIIKKGNFSAGLVHSNVTLSIGHQSFKFGEETSQVKAFLREGNLEVYSGSLKIHG
ncbi:MAG: FapA family protein [Firmicutes bacterium]|nr:FapA family protein [Bacillota bacterium]